MLGISSYLPQKEDTPSATPKSEGESTSAESAAAGGKEETTPTTEDAKKEGEDAKEEAEKGEMESEGYREDILDGVSDDDQVMLKVSTSSCQRHPQGNAM